MDKITGAEFARLAHEAEGFGPGGQQTLVGWIEGQVAALRVLDALGDLQATVGVMNATLERTRLGR